MSNRRIQIGEPFTIRIPRNAPLQVIQYLDEYREHHTLGFGRHLLYLVQKGMESEGLIPLGKQARPRQNALGKQSTQPPTPKAQQPSSNPPLVTSPTPTASTSPAGQSPLSHINLRNFE